MHKTKEEWAQAATRVLELAVSDNAQNHDEGEVPPTKESIGAATVFLSDVSEKLSAIALPKTSISSDGTIHLRWKVSEGRIDVSFSGSNMQAFVSGRNENKAVEISEVPGRVLALLG